MVLQGDEARGITASGGHDGLDRRSGKALDIPSADDEPDGHGQTVMVFRPDRQAILTKLTKTEHDYVSPPDDDSSPWSDRGRFRRRRGGRPLFGARTRTPAVHVQRRFVCRQGHATGGRRSWINASGGAYGTLLKALRSPVQSRVGRVGPRRTSTREGVR